MGCRPHQLRRYAYGEYVLVATLARLGLWLLNAEVAVLLAAVKGNYGVEELEVIVADSNERRLLECTHG
jgi:hypothetical protein